jgi:hypothetical protein
MGTISDAHATVAANHRFIGTFIPEDAAYKAGGLAQATAQAFRGVEGHPAAFPLGESIRRTNLGAGGISTSTTNQDHKPALHAAHRPDRDAGLSKPALAKTAGTGKHATLTADAALAIGNR